MKILFLSFLFSISLTLTSCFMNAAITDLNPAPPSQEDIPVFKNKIAGGEFVSGAGSYEFTQIRRYKVKATVGSYASQVYQVTPKGYRIYNTIQGSLLSTGN